MKFSCDVYPITVELRIKKSHSENRGDTDMFDPETEVYMSPIITLYKDSKESWRWTLVHETLHAISGELRRIGIEHTEETEETYCYVQQYFYEKIVKRVEKGNLLI